MDADTSEDVLMTSMDVEANHANSKIGTALKASSQNAVKDGGTASVAVSETADRVENHVGVFKKDSGTDEENKTNTPNRASLRQRHKKEAPPADKSAISSETSPVLIKEKAPPNDKPINWYVGDVVWALVSGHPLWPCIITNDSSGEMYTQLKGSGNASCRQYHVQFFGESPEHAWINEPRVYKYTDSEEYASLVKTIAKKIPKRPPKVEISQRFIKNWTAAVAEIKGAVKQAKNERIAKYTFKYFNGMPYKPGTEPKITPKKVIAEPKITPKKLIAEPKTTPKKLIAEKKPSADSASDKVLTLSKKDKRPEKTREDINCAYVNATLDLVVKKYMSMPVESVVNGNKERLSPKTFHTCLHCHKVYSSAGSLQKHLVSTHGESPAKLVKTPQPMDESDAGYDCTACGQHFANKRSLGQHRRFSHPANVLPSKPNGLDCEPKIPKDLIAIPVPISKTKTDPLTVTPRARTKSLGVSQNKKDPICAICENNDNVVPCVGSCFRMFHRECVPEKYRCDPFKCEECTTGKFSCVICSRQASGDLSLGEFRRCNVAQCGRHFHATCLEMHRVSKNKTVYDKVVGSVSNLRCPSHTCTTCLSKAYLQSSRDGDLQGFKPLNRARLFKCVRCPTAYHSGDDCLAAGSVLLGGLNIICPAHFKPLKNMNHHNPVHISWCFVCSKGGQLICCSGCPAAFHAECINLKETPDDEWMCLDCSCGIHPLYDDIVWVKLGSYRWWPGQVTHPSDIPSNVSRLNHGPGEFVVRFFGSNDYFWLSKRRVFLYQDGDNGATTRHCSRGISGVFKKALQEAEESFRVVTLAKQQLEEVKIAENGKKPAPYKHIRFNKPVGNVQIYTAALSEIAKCSCRRSETNPCGPESECLNRMLMYECHPAVCPAGDRCQNQRFQKCDYPETEVFKTPWGGWGLRSKVFVKKGAFVNEYVGELVDEDECRRRIELAHDKNVTNFYMLTIDKDRIIDAGPKGNYSRFMNHCCGPNCETQKWSVNGDTRVGLFAIRDITPGEELTFNYNLDCLGNEKTKCMCGSKNCSGFIGVRPKAECEGVKRERKKKRRKRFDDVPQHDDFCFRCRNTGTLVCCDFKGCLRAFCFECLNLEKPPYGKWECPCHHCDWCGRRAQYFCSFCPNSFCASHVHNQLQQSVPNKFDACMDHDPKTAEFEMAQVIAIVNDAMAASMVSRESSVTDTPAPSPKSGVDRQNSGEVMAGLKRKKVSTPNGRIKKSK